MKHAPIIDSIIQPEGLVIGIGDMAWMQDWASTSLRDMHGSMGKHPDDLWRFNSALHEQSRLGHGVCFTLVLWGVFRLRVCLHRSVAELPVHDQTLPLIGNEHIAYPCFPSGEIAWFDTETWNAHSLGRIPPGDYVGCIAGEESPNHWRLKDINEYPVNDSDFDVHLAPR